MSTALEPKTLLTPAEFLDLPDRDFYELVDGELVEIRMSALSSLVASNVTGQLYDFNKLSGSLWIFDSDCGYHCFPHRPKLVRKPDVSVVLRSRLPVEGLERGWLDIPPDLAVEVVSPNDLAHELNDKLDDYRFVKVPLVWVLYPTARTVHVFDAEGPFRLLRVGDVLTGDHVLPGFSCPVEALFPAPEAKPAAS